MLFIPQNSTKNPRVLVTLTIGQFSVLQYLEHICPISSNSARVRMDLFQGNLSNVVQVFGLKRTTFKLEKQLLKVII